MSVVVVAVGLGLVFPAVLFVAVVAVAAVALALDSKQS